MVNSSTRRDFLRASAVATTAASYGRILGANDRIRLGIVGTGGRGQYLMKEINRTGAVEWVAVCDVYSVRCDQAAGIAGGAPKTYNEHERLLEHEDIDAVIVATPDHWHSRVAVDACKAGKDVYIEKPMVHFPADGQAVVAAARENRRVVQVGMQARAIPHFQRPESNLSRPGRSAKWAWCAPGTIEKRAIAEGAGGHGRSPTGSTGSGGLAGPEDRLGSRTSISARTSGCTTTAA